MALLYRFAGLAFLLTGNLLAQPLPQYTLAQKSRLNVLQQALTQERAINYQKALAAARLQGRAAEEQMGNGQVRYLRGIDEETGNLLYDAVHFNARAAATTRTNSLYAGGSLGVSLNGGGAAVQNRLGVWDGGRVYAEHPDFQGRVTQQDNSGRTDRANEDVYHATHVSGTLMAAGLNGPARGMAFGAKLKAWDFSNDVAEMTLAATDLLVSNHSYGAISGWRNNPARTTTNKWEWWGDTTLSATNDFKFGLYSEDTRSWDRIANASPYYLIVKSAGNDRNDSGPPPGEPYFLVQHNNRLSTTPRDQQGGYDLISTYGTAKNVLLVGAISNISNGYQRPSDVSLAGFTSWGPTDDGRIKPDIMGVGVNVISTASSTSFAYGSLSGTSMSSPNVAGSVLLLQEYFGQLNPGRLLRAATLKGLVIHTANEVGKAPGPDYQAGWGLLNMERAAQVIQNTDRSHVLDERTLAQGQTYSLTMVASGRGPLMATICWSDPEAPATTGANRFNNRTPKLINDLDARLSDGRATILPWTLDPENPDSSARPGDNIRDNVEQVYVANPVPGQTYTVTISHKNTLADGNQAFALLVSGAGGSPYCASAPTSSANGKIARLQFAGVNQAGAEGCTTFSDFTGVGTPTPVQPGQPIPLTVTTGTCGVGNPMIIKVFADWEANGTFTEAGNLLATSPVLNTPGTYTTTLVTPQGVAAGTVVRLRLVATETQDPATVQACGTYGNGETQDYLLRVVPALTDVAVAGFVDALPTLCTSTQLVAVRFRNNGNQEHRNLPVRLQVFSSANATVAQLSGTVSQVRANRDVLFTFEMPTSVSFVAGQSYRLITSISVPGDQDTTNNQLIADRTVSLGASGGLFSAANCGGSPTVTLRNGGTGTAFWYDLPTGGSLLAAGNQTQAPNRPVYYAANNEFAGRLGPVAKTDFQGGSYSGNFGPTPLITTHVPLRIDRARLYTGAPGRLTFQVRRFDETVIASTTLDVVATRTLPASQTQSNGQQTDDPNDAGAVYPINLSIPEPGEYKITIEYEEGVTIFRSNSVTAGSGSSFAFPYTLRAQNGDVLASSKGSLFPTSGRVDTLRTAWYYLYDMQLKPLDCPATQRMAVTVSNSPAPTATVAAVANATACQGGAVVLRSTSVPAAATDVLTYQWLFNGQLIAGATSQTYAATQTGEYALQVVSSCAPVSSTALTVLIRQPEVPRVTQNGALLTSNAAAGNQWFENGVLVPGATEPTFTAPQTGRFSVRANVNGCGESTSDELFVAILGLEPVHSSAFRVYPNPTTGRITVELDGPVAGPVPSVQVYDAQGVLRLEKGMSQGNTMYSVSLELSTLPVGTFFVRVYANTPHGAVVRPVLKF